MLGPSGGLIYGVCGALIKRRKGKKEKGRGKEREKKRREKKERKKRKEKEEKILCVARSTTDSAPKQ